MRIHTRVKVITTDDGREHFIPQRLKAMFFWKNIYKNFTGSFELIDSNIGVKMPTEVIAENIITEYIEYLINSRRKPRYIKEAEYNL